MQLKLIKSVWFFSVFILPSIASSAIIHVNPESLTKALGEAKSDDTLVLSTGLYFGPIRLAPGVSLDGSGAILEAGPDTGPAVVLEGTNRILNLVIDGKDTSDVGVRVLRGPVTMHRVHIRSFRKYGVRAGPGDGTFSEGSIQDCGEDGLSAAGGRWTIRSSRFLNNGDDGIDLFKANSTMITSCVFDSNRDAAVEVAISQDVRLIGNVSRGHRVTCAARLGALPSRFSNNRLSDSAFLEKWGDSPVTDWVELERRTDKTNVKLAADTLEIPPPVPVEVHIVQQSSASSSGSAHPTSAAGMAVADKARARAAEYLPYAGLTLADVAMKGQLGSDTNITPLLRKVIEDPFSLGNWLAARVSDGDSSLDDRYRQYVSDLGVQGIVQTDTPLFASENVKAFAESVIRAWKPIDEIYRRSFSSYDSPSLQKLQSDLEAEYAESPELGLPLFEDFEFDIEQDKKERDLINRAAGIDSGALFGSGERLIQFLETLAPALQTLKEHLTAKQASQSVIFRMQTPWGPLVIAGTGDDRHDSVQGFLFDLGGNDEYDALDTKLPVIIMDLSGNDKYAGAVASGIGRLSAAWDGGGNDRYESGSRTQGSGLLGIGILIDAAGDDEYAASRYSQGFGFFGVGWLRDGGGDDVYRIPSYGQGFGGVRGLGVLDDAAGNDRYEILPVNNDPTRDSSRTTSMGQGIGEGLRPQGAGGIGILWDGGGRDEYQADLFAQGIGYWFGFGALIDVGEGSDQYTAYHYVQGAGVHLSVGALYDGGGSDRYLAWYVAQGCGHDVSVGALYDISGNDIYSSYGLSQGAGSTNGVGLLCDGGGRDAYMGVAKMSGQGDAWYQGRLREYGSIGMLLDLGGDDFYATGTFNHAVWFKGDHGLGVDE